MAAAAEPEPSPSPAQSQSQPLPFCQPAGKALREEILEKERAFFGNDLQEECDHDGTHARINPLVKHFTQPTLLRFLYATTWAPMHSRAFVDALHAVTARFYGDELYNQIINPDTGEFSVVTSPLCTDPDYRVPYVIAAHSGDEEADFLLTALAQEQQRDYLEKVYGNLHMQMPEIPLNQEERRTFCSNNFGPFPHLGQRVNLYGAGLRSGLSPTDWISVDGQPTVRNPLRRKQFRVIQEPEEEKKRENPFAGHKEMYSVETERYLWVHFQSEDAARKLLPKCVDKCVGGKIACVFYIHGCEKMEWTKDAWPAVLDELEDKEAVMMVHYRAAYTATSNGDVHTDWVSLVPSTPPESQYKSAGQSAAAELGINSAEWKRLRKMKYEDPLAHAPWGVAKALLLAHNMRFQPEVGESVRADLDPLPETGWEDRIKAAVSIPLKKGVVGWASPYLQFDDIYKVLKAQDPDTTDYSRGFWSDESSYLHMMNPRADGCNKEFVKVSGEDGRGIIFPYGYVSTESNQFGWHCDNNGDVAVNVTLATTSDDVVKVFNMIPGRDFQRFNQVLNNIDLAACAWDGCLMRWRHEPRQVPPHMSTVTQRSGTSVDQLRMCVGPDPYNPGKYVRMGCAIMPNVFHCGGTESKRRNADGKAFSIAFDVPIMHKPKGAHASQMFKAISHGGCTGGCQRPGQYDAHQSLLLDTMHAQIPRNLASGSVRRTQWSQDSEREMASHMLCDQAQCDPREMLSGNPTTAAQLADCPPLQRPLPFSERFKWKQFAPGYEQVAKPPTPGVYVHKCGVGLLPTQPSKMLAHPPEGGFFLKRLLATKEGEFGETMYAVEWVDGATDSGAPDWRSETWLLQNCSDHLPDLEAMVAALKMNTRKRAGGRKRSNPPSSPSRPRARKRRRKGSNGKRGKMEQSGAEEEEEEEEDDVTEDDEPTEDDERLYDSAKHGGEQDGADDEPANQAPAELTPTDVDDPSEDDGEKEESD